MTITRFALDPAKGLGRVMLVVATPISGFLLKKISGSTRLLHDFPIFTLIQILEYFIYSLTSFVIDWYLLHDSYHMNTTILIGRILTKLYHLKFGVQIQCFPNFRKPLECLYFNMVGLCCFLFN